MSAVWYISAISQGPMNAAMASRGAGTIQPVIRASRNAETAVIGQSAFLAWFVFTDAARGKLPSHQPGGGMWMAGYDLRRRSADRSGTRGRPGVTCWHATYR